MMNILICPNAFKNALSATEAAKAIARGLKESALKCCPVCLPVADGGDGSLEVITPYLGLDLRQMEVHGPMGKVVKARYGVSGEVAVVELAEASGIRYVPEADKNVWQASTYGTGQLIYDAINNGARKLYLAVGGSASVDGGLGILRALGFHFLDADGQRIKDPTVSDLKRVAEIIDPETPVFGDNVSLVVLCDVRNPLLGREGAARVFGPQKGAGEADIQKLEGLLSHWAGVLQNKYGRKVHAMPGSGAAGGVAGMMHAVFNAELVSGAEQILRWASFEEHLRQCDLVITGEGQIDEQTYYGKGPGLIAQKAKAMHKKVIGMCGAVGGSTTRVLHFDAIFPIANGPASLTEALIHTRENLRRTACLLGQVLSIAGGA